jgi:hypothetical protein
MRKLFGIASLLALALLLGAQNYPYVPPAPTSGGSAPALIEALCRDHAATAGPVTCANGSSDTTTKAITLGHTTNSGDSIIVLTFGISDGASSGTLTDSGSQTYTKGTNVYTGLQGGHADVTLWYLCNSLAGVTSLTWTPEASDSASGSGMALLHYSGLTSSCHDAATVWSGTAQATPFTGTSATTTNAEDLLLSPVLVDGSVTGCNDKTIVGSGSWTAQVYMHENGDGGATGFLSQIVSSTGSYSATGTSSATGTCLHAGIETFEGTP